MPDPLQRRRLLLAACGLLAVPAALARAAASSWPTRAIRILVAYPPGGVSDLIARELAERLSVQLGVAVVVENKPGASGTVAIETLARSAADGHTLAFGAATAVALVASPVTPVAGVMRTPVLVVGTPALRARSFQGMLAAAGSAPDGVRWATTGEGTTGHAVLERVRRASGVPIVHIPYKGGGQQLNDALAGHFEVLSTNVAPQQLEAIRMGRLAALAVGAPARLPVLPETPTLAELGFAAANLDSLFGLFAPAGTAQAVVDRLNAAVALALQDRALRARLLAANNAPFAGSASRFAAQVHEQAVR